MFLSIPGMVWEADVISRSTCTSNSFRIDQSVRMSAMCRAARRMRAGETPSLSGPSATWGFITCTIRSLALSVVTNGTIGIITSKYLARFARSIWSADLSRPGAPPSWELLGFFFAPICPSTLSRMAYTKKTRRPTWPELFTSVFKARKVSKTTASPNLSTSSIRTTRVLLTWKKYMISSRY